MAKQAEPAKPAFSAPAGAEEIRPGVPVFGYPAGPEMCEAGYQLILDFEVGGGQPYYETFLARPTVPGGESGVTIGVGCDLRFNSRQSILRDWYRIPALERERLADCSGLSHAASKVRVKSLKDIYIPWNVAEEVFQKVTIGKYWQQTKQAFPGIESMCPEAQWGALSVVFNRGPGMTGERAREKREMRAYAARGDPVGMAKANRQSVRVWVGTDIERGMRRRRNAESNLMEACGS